MATSDHTTISGIYIIRNLKNGKFYIGQTNDLRNRWKEHKGRLNAGDHYNRHLQSAWLKYGESAFKFLVLEYCELDRLNEREQVQLNSHASKNNCYNIALDTISPMRGRKVSDETRMKISEATRGKPKSEETRRKLRGRKVSEETRHKISEKALGRKVSEETRNKISEAMRGDKNVFFGKKHNAETRQKMSEAHRNISDETRHKISEAAKNRPPLSAEARQRKSEASRGANNPNFGKKHSDEARRKMSEAAKRRHADKLAKAIAALRMEQES